MTLIIAPRVKVRTIAGWLDPALSSEPVPDPGPIDPPGWDVVFAGRDIDGQIRDWYAASTGHNPALSYQQVSGTLTIDDAWLAANAGNGRVTFAEGRWRVERYHILGTCRINADNVTLRNIHVDGINGILYGFQSQTNAAGLVIEYSTANGRMVSGSTAIQFPSATEPNQIQFRYCNFHGFRAGIYAFGGITAEYCWSHDLHYTPDSHNTGASIRARNVTLRRCLISDGNSAAISCYAETSPYTGLLIQENILKCQPGVGPEVLMAKQYSTPQPGETRRLIANLFELGNLGGDTFGFTEIAGNIDINGEPVTA